MMTQEDRFRAPESQGDDGVGRESIRRSFSFSKAVELLQGNEVEYKHSIDEDLVRRQEIVLRGGHSSMMGGSRRQQPGRPTEEKHSFYRWG